MGASSPPFTPKDGATRGSTSPRDMGLSPTPSQMMMGATSGSGSPRGRRMSPTPSRAASYAATPKHLKPHAMFAWTPNQARGVVRILQGAFHAPRACGLEHTPLELNSPVYGPSQESFTTAQRLVSATHPTHPLHRMRHLPGGFLTPLLFTSGVCRPARGWIARFPTRRGSGAASTAGTTRSAASPRAATRACTRTPARCVTSF
jgi:hypothetical protein